MTLLCVKLYFKLNSLTQHGLYISCVSISNYRSVQSPYDTPVCPKFQYVLARASFDTVPHLQRSTSDLASDRCLTIQSFIAARVQPAAGA